MAPLTVPADRLAEFESFAAVHDWLAQPHDSPSARDKKIAAFATMPARGETLYPQKPDLGS